MNGVIQWSPGVTLEAVEKQVILAAFNHYRGNKTTTANALGIAIRTLDSRLEKYEADLKTEKERYENDRKQREQLLARSRGESPAPSAPQAAARVHVEPAPQVAAQQPVPMPERPKVQTVPSQHASQGHSRSRR